MSLINALIKGCPFNKNETWYYLKTGIKDNKSHILLAFWNPKTTKLSLNINFWTFESKYCIVKCNKINIESRNFSIKKAKLKSIHYLFSLPFQDIVCRVGYIPLVTGL